MAAKKKRRVKANPKYPGSHMIPLEAGALKPDEIVNMALNPTPDPEEYMEYKAITLRPVAEVVALLDGCAKELGMSRNGLAVNLLSGAIKECLYALPQDHRVRACETAAEILGFEIEWDEEAPG